VAPCFIRKGSADGATDPMASNDGFAALKSGAPVRQLIDFAA
jgi:hypothetical protein